MLHRSHISSKNLKAFATLTAGTLAVTCLGSLVSRVSAAPTGTTVAKPNVVPTLTAFKVVQQGPKEALVPAADVRPGDVIEYRVAYENKGDNAVNNLNATLPVPAGTTYVASSVAPDDATASLDGATFAALPLKRTLKTPQGEKVVPVPLREYRFLRWNVKTLAAGATQQVVARVRVLKTGE